MTIWSDELRDLFLDSIIAVFEKYGVDYGEGGFKSSTWTRIQKMFQKKSNKLWMKNQMQIQLAAHY